MLAALSPADSNYAESLSTLHYGENVCVGGVSRLVFDLIGGYVG